MGSLASTSFQLGRQAMAFTHGNSTFNGNNISIVDNPVHNGIVNRAILRRVGVNPVVPVISVVLCKGGPKTP